MRLRSQTSTSLQSSAKTRKVETSYRGAKYVALLVQGAWTVGCVHFFSPKTHRGAVIRMQPQPCGAEEYTLTPLGTAIAARVAFDEFGRSPIVPLATCAAKRLGRLAMRCPVPLKQQVARFLKGGASHFPSHATTKKSNLVVKPKGLVKSNYRALNKQEDAYKRVQNDLIRLYAQLLASARARGSSANTPHLRGVVLDSTGFCTSRALAAALPATCSITVPNNSTDYVPMLAELPKLPAAVRDRVVLTPVSMQTAVQHMACLDFLVADTCGWWNESLRDTLTDAFARRCFSGSSLLSVTVNCRNQHREDVFADIVKFVGAAAAPHGYRFEVKHKLPYGQMLFVLGWVDVL